MPPAGAGGAKGGAGGAGGGGGSADHAIVLGKYLEQRVQVKLSGGRQVKGVLKGYDALMNLVLESAEEFLPDPSDFTKVLDTTRVLGLAMIRGPSVMVLLPLDGSQEIANPFLNQE